MLKNVSSFSELGVQKNLVKALTHEGITSPFPIQAATLPEAISGKDVLGKGQTGSGKTLAFGLTVLTRLAFQKADKSHPLALILAPTRELAMQINDVLSLYADSVGLNTTVLAGGMPYPPQLKALRSGVQIVVATPGRLQDHMKRKTIELSDIEIVVLDEADQMADMGFLPVVTEVLSKTPEGGQRLLFSATLDKDVDKLVKKFMKNPVTHSLDVTSQREADMDHHVLVVDSHVKEDVISQIASRQGRTIFFVRTKRGADRLTEKLKSLGVDVGVLHGGRTQKQRSRVLDAFKLGRKSALIATDVAARGIHVDDVSLVVHVDPPETHKDYLHRAGRTARAGSKGTVVSIASAGNRKRVHKLGKEAGVKMSESKVGSLDPELIRITGATAPSGIPVIDEIPTKIERPKRDRMPRSRAFDIKKPGNFEKRRPKTKPRSFENKKSKFSEDDKPKKFEKRWDKKDRPKKFEKRKGEKSASLKYEKTSSRDERPNRIKDSEGRNFKKKSYGRPEIKSDSPSRERNANGKKKFGSKKPKKNYGSKPSGFKGKPKRYKKREE
ncbi:MAG: hypothetical protein RL129_363 [Actinomycetota bacterium]|jgi:superfamily II DNA/RNA helicase